MTSQDIAWAIEAEREESGIGKEEFYRRAGFRSETWRRALNGKGITFWTINAAADAIGMEIIIKRKSADKALEGGNK